MSNFAATAAIVYHVKPRTDIALRIAHFANKAHAEVHADGCRDLGKATSVGKTIFDPLIFGSDDFFRVLPCAKDRNWTKAEKIAAEAAYWA